MYPELKNQDPVGEKTLATDREAYQFLLGEWEGGHESDPAPSAPQFRFTYIKTGLETLDARFEIAPPGAAGAFTVYLEGSSRRLKSK